MILDKIKDIERKYNLYGFCTNDGYQLWDIVRYDVVNKLILSSKKNFSEQELHIKETGLIIIHLKVLIVSVINIVYLLFVKHKDIFFSVCSRYRRLDSYIDRSAIELIDACKSSYYIDDYRLARAPYANHYVPRSLFRFFYKKKFKKDYKYFESVAKIINREFGCSVITCDFILKSYLHFRSDELLYSFMLRRIRPRKVIITIGQFRSLTSAAHKMSIEVILVQHALLLENDYALCNTCPSADKGYYPDVLLTYGSFWGSYMHHLMKVVTLGNDIMCTEKIKKEGNSILFISSVPHGKYLMPIAKSFAQEHTKMLCYYKLHPEEYLLYNYYKSAFSENKNVLLINGEYSVNDLIKLSRIVVVVVSTVIFESLQKGVKVAIYNAPEYTDTTNMFRNTDNVFFINDSKDLFNALKIPYKENHYKFFEPFDVNVAKTILN